MDILIVANFCMDFGENDNGRFHYLAKLLSRNHDVEIVTSSFYHVTKKQRTEIEEERYKIRFLYEKGYDRNVSLKRFYSHFCWGNNVKKYLNMRKKPDVIYCAIPSLTAANAVVSYCIKNNVRLIVDIQDLWPEAFQIAFNLPIVSTLCFLPFKYLANRVYKNADTICAVSESYVNRGLSVNRKNAKGLSVYLGTELNKFDLNSNKASVVNFQKGDIYIAYCGTLGSSYDIKCVLDAMKILNCNHLKLIVMGEGPKRREFEMYAQENKVNAEFLGRLSYDKMCSILCRCDMTVNPIVGSSVASIINKHADYAACGLPVLNTQNSDEYRKLVVDYEMGLNSESGDAEGLADNIKYLIDNEEERKRMGANSRLCAEQKFDRESTYNALVSAIVGD